MYLWRAFVGFKTGCRQGAGSEASPKRVDSPASRQVSPSRAACGSLPRGLPAADGVSEPQRRRRQPVFNPSRAGREAFGDSQRNPPGECGLHTGRLLAP